MVKTQRNINKSVKLDLKKLLHNAFNHYLSDLFYFIIGSVLGIIAIFLLVFSIYNISHIILTGKVNVITILNSVSYIIISLAIFDISKSIVEEELINKKELSSISEARKTLTKFIVVIVIAISLESLIFIILASKESMVNLIYPCILMLTSSITMISLAVYQKTSVNAELKMNQDLNNEYK